MASPRTAISIAKCLSPQKLNAAPNISYRQALSPKTSIRKTLSPKTPIRKNLSPKTPIRNSLTVERVFENSPISPIFNVDTPYKKKIVNEGFLDKCRTVLGNGAFGTVYKACYKGEPVAAKIIKNDHSKQNSTNAEKETAFLRHSNIVQILKVDEGEALTMITMELCGDSLQDLLKERPLKKHEKIHIWKSIAKALKYCHEMGVIHADVKPKNILMSKNNQPKLADFGSAIFMNEPYTSPKFHGTPGYAAPEVICGGIPSALSDIYSLGVSAWHMLSRKPPFEGLHKHTILYLTGKGITPSDYDLDDGFDGRYKDLYKKSWNKNSEDRCDLVYIISELKTLKTELNQVS